MNKLVNKRIEVLVGLMALVALVVAACGPAATQAPQATAVPTKAPAQPAAPSAPATPTPAPALTPAAVATSTPIKQASAQAKNGGVFLMQEKQTQPAGWDPATASSYSIHQLYDIVGGHLVAWGEGPGRDPNVITLEPDAAEKWEISTDGLAYTFHLRKGLMVEPQHRELTSADFKFTYDRYDCLKSDKLSIFPYVTSIDTPDKYTVVIRTSQPDADMMEGIGGHQVQMFYKDSLEIGKSGCYEATKWESISGFGPFLRGEFKFGQYWTLTKNPNYYTKGLPYLDAIKFVVMPDTSTQLAALRTDAIMDMAPTCKQAETLRKTNPEIKLVSGLNMGATSPVRFNPYRKPFDDVRVRQALSMAIDRKATMTSLNCGEGVATVVSVPAGQAYWFLPVEKVGPGAKNYEYNPEGAKKLLAEAGFGPGKLSIAITATPQYLLDFPELVAGYWQAIGVNATVASTDYTSLINSVGLADTQVKQYSWGRPDIKSFTWDLYHPSYMKAADRIAYVPPAMDPELTKIVEAQRAATDPVKRQGLIFEMQRHVAERVYLIFAPNGYSYRAVRPYVKDFNPMTTGWMMGYWKYVWLDR